MVFLRVFYVLMHYSTVSSKDIVQCSVRREPPPSQRQISLQKAIRLYASNFMQDNLAGLQNLPTEDEIRQLQGVRTARLQLKIAEERQVERLLVLLSLCALFLHVSVVLCPADVLLSVRHLNIPSGDVMPNVFFCIRMLRFLSGMIAA